MPIIGFSVILVTMNVSWALEVYIECTASYDYDYDLVSYETGDCEVWGQMYSEPPATPMYEGTGDFDSGTGSGYYGWTCEWYTDSGELEDGDYTALKYLLEYNEIQDSSSAAYYKAWLHIYKKSGGGWTYVGGDDHQFDGDQTPESTKTLSSTYVYDSSEFKFVFLCRAHLDDPDANTEIINCEIDDNQPTRGLYVID